MLVYLGLGTPEHRSLPTLETTTGRPSRLNKPTIEDACAPAHVYRKLQTCVRVIGKLLLVMAGRTTGSCRLGQASWRVRGGECGAQGRLTVLVGHPGTRDGGHAGGGLRRIEQVTNGRSQLARPARRDQHAGHPRYDQVGNGVDGGRDHRDAADHRLDDHGWQALVTAGAGENGG